MQIDFGDAKKVNDDREEEESDSSSDTDSEEEAYMKEETFRRGTFVGTVNYLAPEMARSSVSTIETDLWALGCIIFKMATGHPAFPGMDLYKVKPAILNRRVAWPEEPIDPTCRAQIEALLQLDPSARLGAPGTQHSMTALMAHPFFEGIDFSSDLTQLNVKSLLNG